MLALIIAGALVAQSSSTDPLRHAEVKRRAEQFLHVTDGRLEELAITAQGDRRIITIPGPDEIVLEVEPVSMRASGYRLLVQGDDGTIREATFAPPRTYRGVMRQDPTARVALSLVPEGVLGVVRMPDGDGLWIQPLLGLVPGARAGEHLVFRGADLIPPDGRCGGPDGGPDGGPPRSADGGVAGDGDSNARGGIAIIELACDADVQYFNQLGSVAGVQFLIEAVINTMNLQYETQVGITHTLTAILVRTAEPDPYSSSDANSLLCQFISEWVTNQSGIQRDVAKLFTGKVLNDNIVGLAANFGEICENDGSCGSPLADGAYCLSQNNFSPDFACATDLAAHELGHLWNCTHCSCPNTTMCPSIMCAGCKNTFAQVSIDEILDYLPTIPCIGSPQLAITWVDFAYSGLEFGSEAQPFNTLVEALAAVTPGGEVRIKAGTSPESVTVNQPVTIQAVGGTATMGD